MFSNKKEYKTEIFQVKIQILKPGSNYLGNNNSSQSLKKNKNFRCTYVI